ncbi:MAG: hypothetical protein M3O70_07705, partial [Actinomycetota bacterium]|nr:hypothetical protein [Actinomycetota bacterium]
MGEPPDNSCGVPDRRDFRRAWRELDPARRERLTQLVQRGHAAQDPSEACLAAGLARRSKRHHAALLFMAPPLIVGGMLGFSALVNAYSDPTARIPLGWSLVIALPVVLAMEAGVMLAWVRRAEITNTHMGQGRPAPDTPLARPLRRLEQALVQVQQAFESETRRRGQWHCPYCGRRIPNEKAPPTTAIGGHWLRPPEEELVSACEQDH